MVMEVLGMDPRALSSEKLTPPTPLPYVSRKALKRVRDRVEPPTDCHFCGGEVRLVSNAEIYGREYGDWPYAYLCSGCRAYVGLHPDTDIPLGTLADKETRDARKSVKKAFFALVADVFDGDRNAGYEWLAKKMQIDRSRCHFGMFSASDCEAALTEIKGDDDAIMDELKSFGEYILPEHY